MVDLLVNSNSAHVNNTGNTKTAKTFEKNEVLCGAFGWKSTPTSLPYFVY